MINKHYNLAEFKTPSKDEWSEKIKEDLKGKDIESLNWKFEGKEYSPFYAKEDIVEHKVILPKISGSILNLQKFKINDPTFVGNSTNALNNGADGIICELEAGFDLVKSLNHIMPQHCYLTILSLKDNLNQFQAYQKYLNTLSLSQIEVDGMAFWQEMIIFNHKNRDFKLNTKLTKEIIVNNKYSNFKNLAIDVSLFKNDELSVTEELAVILSLSVFVINRLLDEGISFKKITSNLFFKLETGIDYFVEISKLRALKWLITEVFKQYDESLSLSPHIHVQINSVKENDYLRQTSSAMSTLLGGADSFTIVPINNSNQEFRIARNVLNILKEESYLDKSTDPSEGSYFIESLTSDIACKSWDTFKSIESNGGIESYFATRDFK